MNLVTVEEIDPPSGAEPVSWRLATTEPVSTTEQVEAIVDAYRARWVIEEYFKALKTGCSIEKRRLESYRSLVNALAMFSVVAWRLLLLRAVARLRPEAPASETLTKRQTVSAGFLGKLSAARTGLSHTMPRATMEQVLEAALDLLLERQAQRKGLGKRARAAVAPLPSPSLRSRGEVAIRSSPDSTTIPPRRPDIPAEEERAVRLRDGDRCQHPLEVGGVCGSTWQVELDHIQPVALGGATTQANLRCACRFHDQVAAEAALGPAVRTGARRRRALRAAPTPARGP